MKDVFGVTLVSLQQDMGRVDRIAQNLANASTPGYKREVATVRPFAEAVDAARAAGERAPVGLAGAVDATAGLQVLTDARPGTLRMTGQPLDVALEGDGFFEVETPAGPAYTRQGDFRVDASGRLVTAAGNPVMGLNGPIQLTTTTPVIDAAGRITEPRATSTLTAAGQPVGQLKVVRFEHPGALPRLGAGLLAGGPGMTVVPEGGAQVRQGALENSNVSAMHELVELMQAMRHFESMTRVAQGYDELLGNAIRKLGDLS
ncbi:MAG: flagellar hook-basal body protein [Anaeromyxobacter sp.]